MPKNFKRNRNQNKRCPNFASEEQDGREGNQNQEGSSFPAETDYNPPRRGKFVPQVIDPNDLVMEDVNVGYLFLRAKKKGLCMLFGATTNLEATQMQLLKKGKKGTLLYSEVENRKKVVDEIERLCKERHSCGCANERDITQEVPQKGFAYVVQFW